MPTDFAKLVEIASSLAARTAASFANFWSNIMDIRAIAWKICHLILNILTIIISIAAAIVILSWAYSATVTLLPISVKQSILPYWITKSFDDEKSTKGLTTTHSSITSWVFRCAGASDILDLPPSIRPNFELGRSFDFGNANKEFKVPNIYETNVAQLATSIAYQRFDLDQRVSSSFTYLQYIQWLTILIGLVTTVVVSVSSAELLGPTDSRNGKFIRVLAIILPAFGTAVAAVNSFYNPRDEWNRASNTLASLSQLHGQIATGIWALECAKNKDDPAAKPLTHLLQCDLLSN